MPNTVHHSVSANHTGSYILLQSSILLFKTDLKTNYVYGLGVLHMGKLGCSV